MAKTKFFRVAVEGATVDGRVIDRAMIQQMAETYNPATYTARINVEHLRGFSPQPPFNAYGSIDAVKAEEVEIELAGKKEKKLALFASFDVNDQAKSINQQGQKLFSSIEINPDFAQTKKAYLVGLALTDSPASLGTEILKFSRDEKRKDHLFALDELELAFEDESAASSEVTGAFAAMKQFFTSLSTVKPEPAPAPAAKPDVAAPDLAAFASGLQAGLDKLATAIGAAQSATETRLARIDADLKAVQQKIETTPAASYTARPAATGGGGNYDMSAAF